MKRGWRREKERSDESQRSREASSFFKLENEVMESAAVAERPIDGDGGERREVGLVGPRGHLNFQRASETK